jgi:hypothetical protein
LAPGDDNSKKETTMRPRLMSLAVACAVALALAGTAAADLGNNATNSVGTVQVSPVTAEPTATAIGEPVDAAVTVPVEVTGSGGNDASDSLGTVQVGGGHEAANSTGSAEVSPTRVAPDATVTVAGSSTHASVPVQVGTDGESSASPVLGSVQVGSDGASSLPRAVSLEQPAPQLAVEVRQPDLDVSGGVGVDDQFEADLQTLRMQAQMLGVTPSFLLAVDSVAQLELGGRIGTAPNDGNMADGSLLTGQAGPVTVAPTLALDSPALASSVAVGGSNDVGGAGTNNAVDSLGTAQVGGGNDAADSVGTVQVGGAQLAPAMTAETPVGSAVLGGASTIEPGANNASSSIGTAQVGGGNNADGSTGTVQVAGVTVGPTLALNGTPLGDVTLGGSSGIAGSGNDANGSTGTAQVGGGNSADRSNGTAQTGPLAFGQTVTYGNTPAGGGSIGAPTQVGAASGNNASDSTGTVQIGGGNSARSSTGTLQIGGERTLASVGSATLPRAAASAAGEGTRVPVTLGVRKTVAGAPAPLGGQRTVTGGVPRLASRIIGTLPFTGLDLALFAALGLALALAGLGVRIHARQ